MTSLQPAPNEAVSLTASRRETLRRLVLVALVIAVTTFLLRAAPLFDPSLTELVTRAHAIRLDIAARRDGGEAGAGEGFDGRAKQDLKSIADETRRCLSRREGLWRLVAGTDRREEAAFKEVERLASSELPALLTAGPDGQAFRERTVDEALARLDDHLAGASPYIPPLKPVENQAGLEKSAPGRGRQISMMQAFLIFDGLLLAGLVVWLWPRRVSRP